MKYSIKVTEAKNQEGNVKGFATLVFGASFKITNIAILENREKDSLFVSMPRYRSSERDENGGTIYKDVCNPITAEFRKELYDNVLAAFEQVKASDSQEFKTEKSEMEMPEFSVTVTPYEREGSNIRGLARVYFEDSFIVNNVSILQGKDKLFVAMPSYKTRQTDKQGKAVYQDVCFPVTKEFREKLCTEIINRYEIAKSKKEEQALGSAKNQSQAKEPFMKADGMNLPFR